MLEYVANYRKLHAKPEKKTYTCDICFEDGLTMKQIKVFAVIQSR